MEAWEAAEQAARMWRSWVGAGSIMFGGDSGIIGGGG